MSRRWAVIGAVLGVLLALVLFAPAAWLAGAVAAATGDRVQLAEPRGSVWDGSARLVFSGGEGSRDALVLPGRIGWEIAPGLSGLHLRLHAGCCATVPLEATLAPAWRRLRLEVADGNSQWPAALLAGLGAPWNTVQPEGQLQLASQGLSVEWFEGRFSMTGSARLDAIGISSRLSTLRPIGSYRLSLIGKAPAGAPELRLQTLEGGLNLSGAGQWSGAHWTFRGEASAAPERESALGNLLNIVGRRQGAKSVISLG